MAEAGQNDEARPRLCGLKKDKRDQTLGRSRGGFFTKLHTACDALGNRRRFDLTAGQTGDAPRALGLIDGIKTKAVLADRVYDSDAILETIWAKKAEAFIPPSPTRSYSTQRNITAGSSRASTNARDDTSLSSISQPHACSCGETSTEPSPQFGRVRCTLGVASGLICPQVQGFWSSPAVWKTPEGCP